MTVSLFVFFPVLLSFFLYYFLFSNTFWHWLKLDGGWWPVRRNTNPLNQVLFLFSNKRDKEYIKIRQKKRERERENVNMIIVFVSVRIIVFLLSRSTPPVTTGEKNTCGHCVETNFVFGGKKDRRCGPFSLLVRSVVVFPIIKFWCK